MYASDWSVREHSSHFHMNSTNHCVTMPALCILIKVSHGGSEAPFNIAHIWGVGCVSYWVYLELMTVTTALCNSSSVQVLWPIPLHYLRKGYHMEFLIFYLHFMNKGENSHLTHKPCINIDSNAYRITCLVFFCSP